MGARAPTPITVQVGVYIKQVQLQQLIERSAFVRSRRNGSSTVDQDSPAEPKVVAGAAKLVENGPQPSVASAKGLVALPQAGSTRVLCSSFK